MKALFIDTATTTMVVGLLVDNKQFITTKIGQKDHAANLINTIDELLKNNNLTINSINQVVVGIGPGSYTGLRVALTCVKMLGFSLKMKVNTISSIAFLTSGYTHEVFGFIDARNNAGFCGMYLAGKMISPDCYKLKDELTSSEASKLIEINEESISINLTNILNNSQEALDVFGLVPNYIKNTKAQDEYDQKSNA